MTDTDVEKRRDEALRRALMTPPAPRNVGGKQSLTDTAHKKKPSGPPVKKDRSEAQ